MTKKREREERGGKKEIKSSKNPWIIVTVILAIALVLVLVFALSSINKINSNNKQPNANDNQGSNQERIEISLGDSPIKGNDNAPVVIVEFSDFECPFCARFFTQTLPLIEENYINTRKVKFAYKHFPLTSIHPYAEKAAIAAECANEQGKFWEYHDLLFQRQSEWVNVGAEKFKEYASELGLDTTKFNECLDSEKYKDKVENDLRDGLNYGVRGTPTFFINGIEVVGAQPYSVFQQVIEQELSKVT